MVRINNAFNSVPKALASVFCMLQLSTMVACDSKAVADKTATKVSDKKWAAAASANAVPQLGLADILQSIAEDGSYGVFKGSYSFFVNGREIVKGSSRITAKPRTFAPTDFNPAESISAEEIAAWNKQFTDEKNTTLASLKEAVANSSCSFKEGSLSKAFPEFPIEWLNEPIALGMLVTEQDFITRMSCLGAFTVVNVTRQMPDPLLAKLNRALKVLPLVGN